MLEIIVQIQQNELINTLHFELPLQIEVNDSGNKLEIGFSNKHTLSRFIKPNKAFFSKETMLLVCNRIDQLM